MLSIRSSMFGLSMLSIALSWVPVHAQNTTEHSLKVNSGNTATTTFTTATEKAGLKSAGKKKSIDELAYDNALFEKLNEVISLLETLNELRAQSNEKPLKLPLTLCLEGPIADRCHELKEWFEEEKGDNKNVQ